MFAKKAGSTEKDSTVYWGGKYRMNMLAFHLKIRENRSANSQSAKYSIWYPVLPVTTT